MTREFDLDDAIKHCEEVAEENYGKAIEYLNDREVYKHEEQKCVKCADEHMQLAEWLRDYKRLKEQEPSGDLISRGEVLENAFKIYTHECGLLDVVGVATIKTLPPVKPQERTGHWINCDYDEDKYDKIKCSECGYIYIVDSYHWCDIGFTRNV
jgi:hypothetical protein